MVQIALNTNVPWTAVSFGSMNVQNYSESDLWNNPFTRTSLVGDVVVIQGLNFKDLNTNYPYSDIIVFHKPDNPDDLIAHRIVATTFVDSKMYFFTKKETETVHPTYGLLFRRLTSTTQGTTVTPAFPWEQLVRIWSWAKLLCVYHGWVLRDFYARRFRR